MDYNDSHDPQQPLQWWFQESNEGEILFIVFYCLACRWQRCAGCNLFLQQSSQKVEFLDLSNQIDGIFANPEVVRRKNDIRKVIISNNGSILDEDSFGSVALMYFIAMMAKNLPSAKILSIETRPQYVDDEELEFLDRSRREIKLDKIEIAVGFEAFSDSLRNGALNKGLPLSRFEELVEKAAKFHFAIKCYFMFKPVEMTPDEAIADIHEAIEYLDQLSRKHHVRINIHLNPTYVARGTSLEKAFVAGRYTPPRLEDVAKAVARGAGTNISIYVGLFDEGLAVEGGSFVRPGDEKIVALLEQFNRTQNFELLR